MIFAIQKLHSLTGGEYKQNETAQGTSHSSVLEYKCRGSNVIAVKIIQGKQ